MSTVVTPPSSVSPRFMPRPLRWTVAEFHRVNSTGIWEGRRPYLLNGVIVEQGPMNPPHATGVELARVALQAGFGAGWFVRAHVPLALGQESDPMPDPAVVSGGPRDYAQNHPTTAVLVVEVSDTTLAADLTDKAELYAKAGIADYWVLDLDARRLFVFRDPQAIAANGSSYRRHLTLGPNDTVSPLAAPGATVRVADLLP